MTDDRQPSVGRDFTMGIVATGMFLPDTLMTAEEIAEASGLPLWVVTWPTR